MNNIIEIAGEARILSITRGFLKIKNGDTETDIPLDSIFAIVVTAREATYTNSFMRTLCEVGIPFIICGDNFHPAGILLPTIGHTRQMEIQQNQIAASLPLKKNIWAAVVREKIRNQAAVLNLYGKKNNLSAMAAKVLSGDTGNAEAIAARAYFPALFGKNFIRNVKENGMNSYLNYGYAVIRAAIARLVVGAGLNPSFGIHHCNKLDAFCLVDDLMEPFRPVVDAEVYKIFEGKDDGRELDSLSKKILATLLHREIHNGTGHSSLLMVMQRYVWSFALSIKEKKCSMKFNKYLVTKDA